MSEKTVFISHRSTDENVADMLLDFMATIGFSKNNVFCSSLPGNDVKSRISLEIKCSLKNSLLNIVILSEEYYNSAYCLNEAGVIWFRDEDKGNVIVIALPEVTEKSMLGFLDDDYKLRRLDNRDDIAAIYDVIKERFEFDSPATSALNREIDKLVKEYSDYISTRTAAVITPSSESYTIADISTDDERVILYYLLLHEVRKTNSSDIAHWLIAEELKEVNVANAFDLLSVSGLGILDCDKIPNEFMLDLSTFRQLSNLVGDQREEFKKCAEEHRDLSKDRFAAIWAKEQFDDCDLLFIAYICEENCFSFGWRGMANRQTESIKEWERKNDLEDTLSKSYDKCLNKYIDNDLVFESSWTTHGNPCEYSLYTSIKEYFKTNPYGECLQLVKSRYCVPLPF